MYIIINKENNDILGSTRILPENTEDNILYLEVSEEIFDDFNYNPNKYYFKKTLKVKENYIDVESQIKKIQEIKKQLKELDEKRIRAICEPSIKDETSGETWLDYYNSQILILREELIKLQ